MLAVEVHQSLTGNADVQFGAELKYLEEIAATIEQQLGEQKQELERLRIVAPVAGVIIPATPRPLREQEGMLPSWSGSPLDPKNLGATYMESDLICRIAIGQRLVIAGLGEVLIDHTPKRGIGSARADSDQVIVWINVAQIGGEFR